MSFRLWSNQLGATLRCSTNVSKTLAYDPGSREYGAYAGLLHSRDRTGGDRPRIRSPFSGGTWHFSSMTFRLVSRGWRRSNLERSYKRAVLMALRTMRTSPILKETPWN